jgi:hypothetical protein
MSEGDPPQTDLLGDPIKPEGQAKARARSSAYDELARRLTRFINDAKTANTGPAGPDTAESAKPIASGVWNWLVAVVWDGVRSEAVAWVRWALASATVGILSLWAPAYLNKPSIPPVKVPGPPQTNPVPETRDSLGSWSTTVRPEPTRATSKR